MGVSGCGKTVVGRRLAAGLRMAFIDADDLHPVANVRKMTAGEPLTDADRGPWLEAVAREMTAAAGEPGLVIACSALKRTYRDQLRRAAPNLVLVWLTGPTQLIRDRLAARTGHFMPADLLQSQLETLEPPAADERPIVADTTPPPKEIAASIAARANLPFPAE
ncbi:MAG: gluconokinase [Planctomycetaceae bacterium]